VVRERKGEHLQVFEQLRAQGFVRARVDGHLYDLDAVPALSLRQKHTIEAVVDRFKPRADIKQRLAESFETARSATTRCRSSSRACSRSTRRSARARNATDSALPSSSIPPAS
jgi:excinuclease UvrABC ATPase subunit